jgi:methylmalonyl-CoA/ethylmalonyl-CoA epimerase
MFTEIQHIGYQVRDLDSTVAWFARSFGGERVGGGPTGSGGSNAFVRFGQIIEVELLQPPDATHLQEGRLEMHHVGYVVYDIDRAAEVLSGRGLKFAAEQPITNVLSQKVRYLDPSTTNDVLIHLTQLPEPADNRGYGAGADIRAIVHAGYVVEDLDAAVAWYVENFGGEYIGGGMSRRGVNNAFVNFGQVQVELLEPNRQEQLAGKRHNMDHAGYVVPDIITGIEECQGRGLVMGEAAPRTNTVGQQLCYFDIACTCGTQIHLTQLPD